MSFIATHYHYVPKRDTILSGNVQKALFKALYNPWRLLDYSLSFGKHGIPRFTFSLCWNWNFQQIENSIQIQSSAKVMFAFYNKIGFISQKSDHKNESYLKHLTAFIEGFLENVLDLLYLRKKFDQSLKKGTETPPESQVSNADLTNILNNAQKLSKESQNSVKKKPARALRTGQPRLSGRGFPLSILKIHLRSNILIMITSDSWKFNSKS